ncbi:ABC transporter permease [Candidatus Dependentiae bacterium]|nr:ABC transporter permease [Candidatus Dependentiae bacterium]MCG2756053.1 ABC transporter permease [Candidatus Dependentiae bacterium]
MVIDIINFIGTVVIEVCNKAGKIGLFFYESLVTLFTTKLKIKKTFYQMSYIGIGSIGVVVLIGITVGAVLAFQSYVGLHRFGAERFIGPIIFIAMVREFGPVLTAIMVIGRAGSAMTAEIGTMRITEQIDALQTLCIDVKQYLIVPRIFASTIIIPFLSIFCSLCGILAGYFMSVYVLGISSEMYTEAIKESVVFSDITNGIIKAVFFGLLLSLVSTYKGYTTTGGAKGVGISTTQSVVLANVIIFIADYILTALMF